MDKVLFSSQDQCWCTPNDFFDELNKEFHFTLDAAATEKSAKCEYFFTPEIDGLSQDWVPKQPGSVFCNPPYGKDIKKWVKKAYEEFKKHGTTIVLLIPARTDTSYFHDYIYHKAELRFIRGRLKFNHEDGTQAGTAPFPSMLVIYGGKSNTNDVINS